MCTFESDEELQHDLESWRDALKNGAFGETAAGRVLSSLSGSGSDGEGGSSSGAWSDEDELDGFGGIVEGDGTVTYRF